MQAMLRGLAYAALFSLISSAAGLVQAVDRDQDNDGCWDFNRDGTDRDIDNDGRWGYGKGGTDRRLDNDKRWDYEQGGTDLDNDGQWDQ
ncbi:hypothetical protein D3C78_1620900 [compost metagenome]